MSAAKWSLTFSDKSIPYSLKDLIFRQLMPFDNLLAQEVFCQGIFVIEKLWEHESQWLSFNIHQIISGLEFLSVSTSQALRHERGRLNALPVTHEKDLRVATALISIFTEFMSTVSLAVLRFVVVMAKYRSGVDKLIFEIEHVRKEVRASSGLHVNWCKDASEAMLGRSVRRLHSEVEGFKLKSTVFLRIKK